MSRACVLPRPLAFGSGRTAGGADWKREGVDPARTRAPQALPRSTAMNYDDPHLLDRLAAEYVFGSLPSRARRRFERLRQRLPAAEKAVLDWERRLMPLSGPVPAERPPGQVWNAIEQRTGGATARRTSDAWWTWLRPLTAFALGVVATLGGIALLPGALPIESIVQQRGTLPQ